MSIKLPSSSLIELTGADAATFAHAQFSSDVAALADVQWQWSAWLSPQGRVRAFFALLRYAPDRLVLILRGGDAQTLCALLRRFVLRSKVLVRVDEASPTGAFDVDETAAMNDIDQSGGRSIIRLPGARAISLGVTPDESNDSAQARWRRADIRDGIVELAATLEDAALPQWLGLDRLGAVSVRKGCYPGQEIMSRLHFKGGNKRSLYRVEIDSHSSPFPGATIAADTGHVGQIVMAERDGDVCVALAIVSHDGAERALMLDAPAGATVRVLERFT
jgi:folate-binding protein YgfZ